MRERAAESMNRRKAIRPRQISADNLRLFAAKPQPAARCMWSNRDTGAPPDDSHINTIIIMPAKTKAKPNLPSCCRQTIATICIILYSLQNSGPQFGAAQAHSGCEQRSLGGVNRSCAATTTTNKCQLLSLSSTGCLDTERFALALSEAPPPPPPSERMEKIRGINWNFDYIDELTSEFRVKIHDESIDERLANVVHTANFARLSYLFIYKFDSPLAGVDNSQLELLAAGPKVDDALCGQHLTQMLDQMHQMRTIIELRKIGGTTNNSTSKEATTSRRLDEKHLRLAKVLDSFGRYEAGALVGRNRFAGSYTQCKGSQLLLGGDGEQLVPCRYCTANLDTSKHLDADLKMAKGRQSKLEPLENALSVGICLPESCHTKSFAQNKHLMQALVDSQFELPSGLYEDQHLPLESVFCEIDRASPLVRVPLSGKLLLVFVAVWLAAILYSTYYNNTSVKQRSQTMMTTTNSTLEKCLQCLDLRAIWEDFTGVNETSFEGKQHRVSLNTLNPVKVLGCWLVVHGHALMIHQTFAMNSLSAINEMQSDPKLFFFIGSTVIVDTFYVITGMMASYVAMKRLTRSSSPPTPSKELQNHHPIIGLATTTTTTTTSLDGINRFLKNSAGFVLNRYLRLVPLYFLVFWFKKSLMTSLSSGPFWDHGYNRETEAGACREESWLTPFTFQAAYLPLSRQCMPQAWSVAGDLYFSFIMGPILALLTVRPILAILISIVISLTSNMRLLMSLSEIPADIMDDLMNLRLVAVSRIFKLSSFLYTAPHYRACSVMMGVLAGYALYHYGKAADSDDHHHQDKPTSSTSPTSPPPLRSWPSWFRGTATRAALIYIVSTMAMSPLIPALQKNLLGNVSIRDSLLLHMASTNRLLWALSNAVVFLRVVTDWKDNYWMRNSAGKFWSSMAKLNLALLLVHIDLLKLDHYNYVNTHDYSGHSELRTFATTYLFGSLIALLLYILFESPMDRLVKYATSKAKK